MGEEEAKSMAYSGGGVENIFVRFTDHFLNLGCQPASSSPSANVNMRMHGTIEED